MRIARLELFGFKSFPDRTVFEFGEGVSCVVGPNGSGKSNVVDAIRWCIGEQSARRLRGSEMFDVIFAGSADRASVGFAEVRMTLSADTGEPFPGEYAQMAEIQVGRRLHRNGTSEYILNGVKCRRRDIVELFLDTGVGNNLYSFIAQGQVERIVHASAADRRGIIDEAAGISRYAARRSEAQQRLESTGAQLDRAADVADEMQRRLRTLERQVVRAARFRRIRALLRQEEIYLGLVSYGERVADRRAIRERLRQAQNEGATQRRELLRREADLTARREELAVVEAAASQWRDEVAELDARSRELESTATLQGMRRQDLLAQGERAAQEGAEAERVIAREQVEVERATAVAAGIEPELASNTSDREARTAAATAASEHRAACRSALDAVEAEVAAATAAAVAGRARIEAMERQRVDREQELARAREAVEAAEREVARREVAVRGVVEATEAAGSAVQDTRQAHARVQEVVDAQTAAVDVATKGLLEAEQALDAARRDLDAAVEEAARQAESDRRQAEGDREEVERQAERDLAAARVSEASVAQRGQEALDAALAEAATLSAARRAEAEAARGVARDAVLETHRLRHEELVAAVQALDEAQGQQERLQGQRDRCVAESARLDGLLGEGIPGLDDSRSLVDRLELDLDHATAWAARVGDRVLLPVVETVAAVEAVLDALDADGETRLLLSAGGDPRGRWEAAWTPFDTVRDAVEHHLQTGEGATGPGIRVDADGVVHLGRAAAAASALHARERREALQVELASLETRLAEVMSHIARAAEALRAMAGTDDPLAAHETLQQARTDAVSALESQQAAMRRAEGEADEAARREIRATAARALADQVAAARHRIEEVVASGQAAREAAGAAVEEHIRAVAEARDRAREAGAARVEASRTAVKVARSTLDTADQQREQARAEARTAARALAAAELAGSRADAEVRLARAAVEEARQGVQQAGERVEALTQTIERLDTAMVRAQEAVAQAAVSVEACTERVTEQRTVLQRAEAEERRILSEASAQAAQVSALQERLEAATAMATAATERAREASERRGRAIEASEALQRAAAEAAQARQDAETERIQVADQRGGVWDKLQRERERMSKLRVALTEAETARQTLQHEAEQLGARIAELETESHQVRVDIEVLRHSMEDRYQVALSGLLDRVHAGPVTIETAEEVRDGLEVAGHRIEPVEDLRVTARMLQDREMVEAMVTRNHAHREALQKLGDVNLSALEEYRDLDKRFADLSRQREDLEVSVADIRRAIAKMNRTCRQRFRDAFDRVNESFQKVYPGLLGGGSARLSLTNEEDLLQTGVEIYVQPPGKRLQNLTLLSGGEKAMTAIALVIALFKVKPSPFCVLDEVDAPLDEANGARFNEIIREMSRVSQFLVVTHNRKTMECADTLYGVTMAAPGVSRLVSVNLAGGAG